ncbi:MRL1, partial [Symbiodinium sp. KB8]
MQGASGALLPALGDALWTVAAVAAPRDLQRLAHVSPAVNVLLSPVAERTARISELTRSLNCLPVQFGFPLASLGQKWLEEALARFSTLKLLRWREKAGELAGWVPTEEDRWPALSREALLCAMAAVRAAKPENRLLFAAVLRLQPLAEAEGERLERTEIWTAPLAFEWADGPAADPLQMALQLGFLEGEARLNLEMISGGWSDWSECWSTQAGTLEAAVTVVAMLPNESHLLLESTGNGSMRAVGPTPDAQSLRRLLESGMPAVVSLGMLRWGNDCPAWRPRELRRIERRQTAIAPSALSSQSRHAMMDCIPEDSLAAGSCPREPPAPSDGDASSEFSSAASLSRQCTEFSDAAALELMSRQFTDFATRQGDFWVRKCTEPVVSQRPKTQDPRQGQFGRQSSCPTPSRPQMAFDGFEGLGLANFDQTINEESQEEKQEDDKDDLISKAICAAVAECDFSVAIADPTGLDFELIAVSEEFHRLTGYSAEESVGENCRFLNSGCPNDAGAALRLACETGAPFTSILVNRRKSGEFFLNLLSMRGLVLATDSATGEDIWILVSVQRDVSLLPAVDLPSNDAFMLKVANRITRRLYKYATELGIASIIHSRGRVTNGDSNGGAKLAGMHMLAEVTWKLGEQMGSKTDPAQTMIQILKATWPEALGQVSEIQAAKLRVRVINYNSVVKAFASDALWRQALSLAVQLLQKSIGWSVITCNTAGNSCGRAQQWRFALLALSALVNHSLQQSISSCNTALQVQSLGMKWQQAVSTLEGALQGAMVAEPQTLNTVIRACSTWDDAWEGVLSLLRKRVSPLPEHYADVFTYTNCLACLRGETWVHSTSLLQNMRAASVRGNLVCQGAVVTSMERGGQWQRALQLIEKANLIVFNAAISACAKAAEWQRSLDLLVELNARRLQKDVITCNAAVAACVRGRQWQLALRLLQAVWQEGLRANAVSYTLAVGACSGGSHWEQALVQLAVGQAAADDVVMRMAGIDANSRGEEWQKAFCLLDTLGASMLSYGATISSCEGGGRWEPAMDLLTQLRGAAVQLNTVICNTAISTCEKAQEWQRAVLLLEHIQCSRRMQPDLITYNAALAALAAVSRKDPGAAALAAVLLEQIETHGFQCNLITWNAAITACGDQWEAALDFLSRLERSWCLANAITFAETVRQGPLDALKFLPADFLYLRGAPLESEEPKDGDGELVEHQPGPNVSGNSSPHWPTVLAGSSFAALTLLLLCRHMRRSVHRSCALCAQDLGVIMRACPQHWLSVIRSIGGCPCRSIAMPFSDFAKVRNVRPEVSLDGDGLTFDEEELTAALGKLEKLDTFDLATPTSTECPEDFLPEDEAEEEVPEVQPISSTSTIRRFRLREHRREMVREYLAKHGFQDANQPKSTHSSFFRTETIYPIHHAAKLGHYLMVRELLRYGVDRDVTTSRGRTAYDLAAEADKLDSHRMVLDLLSGVWNSTTLRELR